FKRHSVGRTYPWQVAPQQSLLPFRFNNTKFKSVNYIYNLSKFPATFKINRLFRTDMEAAINTAVSIEFLLSENYEKSPPVIYIIFDTAALASEAYRLFLRRFTSYKCSA